MSSRSAAAKEEVKKDDKRKEEVKQDEKRKEEVKPKAP
jgi:hypothetical protein